jgi:subtilisin family serine protease
MHSYWLLAILGLILALEINSKAEETRTKIAIIDTGLDLDDYRFKNVLCSEGHKDLTGVGISDTIGHGTFVAGLVQRYAGKESEGKYCIVIIKYYLQWATGAMDANRMTQAIKHATEIGAKFINISSGGESFRMSEYDLIKDNPSSLFIVAAGNNSMNVETPGHEYYPAAYRLKNIVVVGSVRNDGTGVADFSNYGDKVDAWEPGVGVFSTEINWVCEHETKGMLDYAEESRKKLGLSGCCGYQSGTSFSTAIHTGKLVRQLVNEGAKMGCQDHSCSVRKKYN